MIDKKVNAQDQILRMKNLMNYGLNESKEPEYSSVEYSKLAADGKLYGIIREGSKFYIKVAKNPTGNLVAENFDYIGGFRNRKENMFESFAGAQRFFCEKMMCINESVDDIQKRVIAESWDLDAKKETIEEGTKKMQAEIARQRQIMKNAQKINEGKVCDMIGGCPKTETIKVEEPSDEPGAPFTEKPGDSEIKGNEKTNIKGGQQPVVGNKKNTNESSEVPLVSRKDPDYMDKSHGTKIGNNAPFTDDVTDQQENAVADAPGGEAEAQPQLKNVNEETAMHDEDNQNSPTPGVGEKGDNEPYDEIIDINENLDDIDVNLEDDEDGDELDVDVNGEDVEGDVDAGDDADMEGEDEGDVDLDSEDEDEGGLEMEPDDTTARLDAMEEKLNQILDALNNMKYDDDTLYDDGEDDTEEGDDLDNGEVEDDDDEEFEVVESKSYKAMKRRMGLKEEEDFGKHPAFQKVVMTTPAKDMPEGEGQYDMNDESADNDKPYATQKGSQAPFEITPEQIDNAITEAITRELKKKLG